MVVSMFEILCACVVILYLLYHYLTSDFAYWTSRGVNGPKPIPFFGNIANFMLGNNSLGGFYKEIYDRYPNDAVVGIFLRGSPVLLLRDPDYIKQVLIKDFTSFANRQGTVYEKADPMSMHLFRLDAVRWRPLRTRLSPTFTSGKLKDMFHLLLNCSDHFEKYLDNVVSKDSIVECRDLTAKFTIDVIGSCAFGLEMNALKEEDNKFYQLGRKIFRASPLIVFRTMLREVPSLYKRFGHILSDRDVTKFMTDITRDTIEYRKRNNVRRHDFIDTLIELKDNPDKLGVNNVTDEFIAAQAFVFFAAGFETSSSTMSFALYELAQNQSIQDKVRNEIKEVLDSTGGEILYESIKMMTYLNMIFRETLRKYPIVMFLTRKAIKDYTFEGTKITLRKKQEVIIPVYALQNDPNIYPDPEVFDPERFNVENVKQRNPMYHLPFGDGPRNCIGARFAVNQTMVGLIKVLMNYKIEVCEKTQIPLVYTPLSTLLLQSTHGIYVKLTKLS
ncbi:PREDICTED: cytochrome P450 6a2-like [Vollenhovia emeryi]|uniref:cytochrome P450 6a2-like n=1 Tax=Vollenhovia emeryi TaxID=411798 RepID=UPI0005F3DC6D|nr:PREDICTED: cytochrome P450 6a2-like [Vollenhovia emeryi]